MRYFLILVLFPFSSFAFASAPANLNSKVNNTSLVQFAVNPQAQEQSEVTKKIERAPSSKTQEHNKRLQKIWAELLKQ